MFGINEVCDGKGILTLKDGKMYLHVTLKSKSILNLFPGLAADAQKEGAAILQPTTDTVTYADGTTEEVYGFDVPVPYLDKEFDLALVGTKGTWYDHKVSVSQVTAGAANAQVVVGSQQAETQQEETTQQSVGSKQTTKVILNGGSGKATIESPAEVIKKDGKDYAVLIWTSKNYDYMIVDGVKYINEARDGENTKFTIPILAYGEEITVIGDTVAMSTPHEIEYTIIFELVQE